MRRSNWLDGLRASLAHSPKPRARSPKKRRRIATRRPRFEPLEDRSLLATLTVNSPLDNNTPGDGLVTLREAIFVANTNTMTDLGQIGSGADTIEFDPTVFGAPQAISLTSGQLTISESLTIDGPGSNLLTIDAQGNSRIFEISGSNVAITGLALSRGLASGSGQGGAIQTSAQSTTIDDCIVQNSVASSGGGGIAFSNPLIISNSIIRGNSAVSGNGGGVLGRSPGDERLTLINSTLSGNSASGSGGGFYASCNVEIINSSLSDNNAGKRGGGFALHFQPTNHEFNAPDATVVNSTITRNRATESGGGFSAAFVLATDSTITQNSTQGFGGGFAAPAQKGHGSFISGDVQLIDCVISGNTAATTGGGFFAGNVSRLTSTIVSGNSGGGIHAVLGAKLNSSTVSHNVSSGSGGGIFAPGTYFISLMHRYYQLATVDLESCIITGNTSGGSGGGIYARSDVRAANSTISANKAAGDGGGIFVKTTNQRSRHSFPLYVAGSASIRLSTVEGNQSGGAGGGIHAREVSVITSTISGNLANTGGGIYSHKVGSVQASTISGNQALNGTGGGIWNGDDEIPVGPNRGPLSIDGSIVAGNIAGGGSPDIRPGTGALTVTGSLIGDNAGTPLGESHTIDALRNLIGSSAGGGIIDPRLAPLADNGGPTRTHALLPDSPAIDAFSSILPIPTPPAVVHDYRLDGSLADQERGPSLVALGGTLLDSTYNFGPNQGLDLSSALANPARYSIEVKFRWDTLSPGTQKILDFKNLTSNAGLYTTNAGLQFFGGPFAAQVFLPNEFYRLVLTRDDATDIVRAYLNGTEVWNFVDAAGETVFNGPGNIIHFFQDDHITGQAEAQSGLVDLIRLYNSVLTPAQVASLTDPSTSQPTYDQRGEPFLRLRDGDQDGLLEADMGSFELQTIPNTPPVLTSPTTASVVQGNTEVMLLTANDSDMPSQGVTFSIIGGADQAKLVIPPTSFGGPIDVPNAFDTYTGGISDAGVIVGGARFPLPRGGMTQPKGFAFDGTGFITIDVPQSISTVALDINSAGAIVGSYTDSNSGGHGFKLEQGQFSTIDFPGGQHANVWSINDLGHVAGSYVDNSGKRRGFVFDGATYSTVHFPGAAETFVTGISDNGLVVGYYYVDGSSASGFLFDGSLYRGFRFPNSTSTHPNGVNSDGVIVGTYGTFDGNHGFVYDGIKFTTLDFPQQFTSTSLNSINDLGEVVGTYRSIFSGEHRSHVFTANLPSQLKYSAPLKFFSPPVYGLPTDANGDNVYEVVVQARDTLGGTTTQLVRISVTSAAQFDYGDAPDTGTGTGPGNYNTTASDNGPRHSIVSGLRIGAVVDADGGSLQNGTANADDVNAALPDDEDGVSNPAADLVLTIGTKQGGGGFTLFDVLGYIQTVPNDINDLGQIVGAVHNVGEGRGFLKDGSTIATFGYPGAQFSHFTGINDVGVIVGNTSSASDGIVSHGFVKNGQELTPIDVPGAEETFAHGINSIGQVVGDYRGPLPAHTRGFVKDGSIYTLVDVPFAGAITTEPRGINDDGIIVGFFRDPNTFRHGFVKNGSTYTQFDFPGAEYTDPFDINDAGQIVGTYFDSTSRVHGFLKHGDAYTTIDVPGAVATIATGMNNLGQIVGWYSTDNNDARGFVYTLPSAGPTVSLRVTNSTGSEATLFGWIDYNGNGVFDNATERASVAVPNGTNNGVVTLVFPAVPSGFTGTTYARFRLSTDTAAANPVGPASDGEVEDYRVIINRPGDGTADSAKTKKIAAGMNGGPALVNGDMFGASVAAIGDLDGDGVEDMAVGAPSQTGSGSAGAVFIQFMNANGTVNASQRIASGVGGGPTMAAGDYFGHSVAALGDLDGDGVNDLAVGASKDDTGGYISGAVYVLFMNTSGTVKSSQKIASGVGGGPTLFTGDRFGTAVSSIGDLDGDGVGDLAVGAAGDDTGGSYRGAVQVLFMNANGTVKSSQKIASGVGGGPALTNLDFFGGAVANLGDLDGDGITELAVGASGDDTSGTGRGAAYILFLNSNGAVKTSRKIASGIGGAPVLADGDYFGRSVASLGDLDGDGITDLAVGAYRDDTGGASRGAVHVLFLNANGTVKRSEKIAQGIGGGPILANDDRFGSSIAALGDLDGDGIIELAVGAETDNTGGTDRGAVYTLFLNSGNTSPVFTSPAAVSVPENSTAVMTVTASDADVPPQTVTFSIVGGTDQAKFSISSSGALSFNTPPNYEAPNDANGDNVYEVTVQASDGKGGVTTQTIHVTVTPVNEHRPVITSPDAVSVAENTTAVLTVTAIDADLPPQPITFSIVGGADQARFNITPSGVLSFNTPPNFEAPTDTNGDNVYVVIVQASDGSLPSVQAILVTVTNVVSEPLVGDYNDNGIVDLADYVLWRNGGPLQNEGASPGAVNQEDYSVWRANFGRTAPAAGAGSMEQGARSVEHGAAGTVLGEAAPMDAATLDSPQSRFGAGLPWLASEVISHRVDRPLRRSVFTADRARHDALFASLTSKRSELEHDLIAGGFADSVREISPSREHAQASATFELAFAELGRSDVVEGFSRIVEWQKYGEIE